jgi:hypothetical protein
MDPRIDSIILQACAWNKSLLRELTVEALKQLDVPRRDFKCFFDDKLMSMQSNTADLIRLCISLCDCIPRVKASTDSTDSALDNLTNGNLTSFDIEKNLTQCNANAHTWQLLFKYANQIQQEQKQFGIAESNISSNSIALAPESLCSVESRRKIK